LEQGKTNTDHQRKAGGEDRLEGDDGGHLIAKRFGGSEKVDNIVPMDSHLNRGDYKNMENRWAKAVERGDNVDVKINCKYEGDSQRPSSINVYYKITDADGNVIEQDKRRFRN
jgi:predicted ribonuclease toxin of YeeF-YezG toxin-antitoxin module